MMVEVGYNLGKDLLSAIAKWRKFNNKRIRITVVENTDIDGTIGYVLKKITEGTIDDIFEIPPGLMLKDVSEWRVVEKIHAMSTWDNIAYSIEDKYGDVKKSPERMVPFKELGTVDFLEDEE